MLLYVGLAPASMAWVRTLDVLIRSATITQMKPQVMLIPPKVTQLTWRTGYEVITMIRDAFRRWQEVATLLMRPGSYHTHRHAVLKLSFPQSPQHSYDTYVVNQGLLDLGVVLVGGSLCWFLVILECVLLFAFLDIVGHLCFVRLIRICSSMCFQHHKPWLILHTQVCTAQTPTQAPTKRNTDRTSHQTQAGIGHSAPAHRGGHVQNRISRRGKIYRGKIYSGVKPSKLT